MNDHVAVLRVLRDFYSGSVLNHPEKAAALTYAITLHEQHDALVARLGELKELASRETPEFGIENVEHANDCRAWVIATADDLARVVKENNDG